MSIRKFIITLAALCSLGLGAVAQEMTRDSLLVLTEQALGLPVLDTAKTLKYDLKVKSGDLKQEYAVVAKGKRKIAAASQNPAQPMTYVRNGANYFMLLNGQTIDLPQQTARKNLNSYNFIRGMANLIKVSDDMELVGIKDVDGTDYWHLKVVEDQITTHLFIDQVTHLPFRKRIVRKNNQGDITRLTVITLSDYITVNGVSVPGKQRLKKEQNSQEFIETLLVSNLEVGIDIANSVFMAQ